MPDDSVFEHDDPSQPLTGGGHNWVFDQGSTLCKMGDVGAAGGVLVYDDPSGIGAAAQEIVWKGPLCEDM